MTEINLEGMDKAVVLAALYNASKPQGMGFMQYDPAPMTVEQARQLLERCTYFDYLKGRVMKIDLSGDVLETWGYDRDNGDGAAQRAINAALQSKDVNNTDIQSTHKEATHQSALDTEDRLGDKSSIERRGGMTVLHLGLDDVAEQLRPKIDAVKNAGE